MSNKLTATFALCGFAIILWTGTTALSSYLAEDLFRAQHAKGMLGQPPTAETKSAELPPAVVALLDESKSNPSDTALKLRAGKELLSFGQQSRDVPAIMKALEQFHQILESDPDHGEALLTLASVSFETGLLDKAAGYYKRYLDKHDDDAKASNDYGLVLLRQGNTNDALDIFESLLKQNPNSFPTTLSAALAQHMLGDKKKALALAAKAKTIAPDEESRGAADAFIEQLSKPSTPPASQAIDNPAPPAAALGSISPAMSVSSFFEQHPIVGPKLAGINWPELDRAVVLVKDFPVHQMPAVAKDRFISRIQSTFASLPKAFTIELRDSNTKSLLLSVEAGASAESTTANVAK